MIEIETKWPNVMKFLKEHGKEIGKAGLEGDENAKQIMRYYEMLYRCYDDMTAVLLEAAIGDYAKENNLHFEKRFPAPCPLGKHGA